MDLDFDNLDSYSMAELNKWCRERDLKLADSSLKIEYAIPLQAFEEVCRLEAVAQDQDDDEKKDTMDEEDDKMEAEEVNSASAPEVEGEAKERPTGVRSPIGSSTGSILSSHPMSPQDLQDMKAERKFSFQLA
ncbi:hypothetical protein NDU88_004274 [Pleurodeles waltl]|uniref:Uncharacterized protein n=1 Tax=Pleurodeles waltl TaxID=8319 RepID=A0AAV7LJD4_PLEWA|nr:hypothetical protein NDU88_004274 [Pleurodeles waltl]